MMRVSALGLKGFGLFAALIVLSACSSTAPKQEGVAPVSNASAGSRVTPGTQADLSVNVGDTVYFELDSHALRTDAQATLQKQAAWLKSFPQVRLVIEGHCDERGTREYNLALGDRRSGAVREFLVALGIDGNRLESKSYGKERPVCAESDEDCWGRNRRGYALVLGSAGS
jgi:peptidoglycan-associated lipoprotein